MTMLRRWTILAGAAVALAALACSDNGASGAGPRPVVLADPALTATRLQAIDGAVTTPILRSLTALTANATPAPLAAALARAATPLPPYAAVASRGETLRQALLGRPAAALLRRDILGKTYVWDTTTQGYVASSRTGAPPNGVRLALYAIDPLTQRPSVPLAEIGYADLVDLSSGSTYTLEVILEGTSNGAPARYGDYTITGTLGLVSAKGNATGYVTDQATRVDFTISLDVNPLQAKFTSTFDVSPQQAHITLVATVEPAGSGTYAVTIDFRLATGSQTVTARGPVTVTQVPGAVAVRGTLTVQVNGNDFASITLTDAGATFQGVGGRPLSADELRTLQQLYAVPQDVLAALENAMMPVDVALHLQ